MLGMPTGEYTGFSKASMVKITECLRVHGVAPAKNTEYSRVPQVSPAKSIKYLFQSFASIARSSINQVFVPEYREYRQPE